MYPAVTKVNLVYLATPSNLNTPTASGDLIHMAKGGNDIILRDRLQFDVTGGDVATVYGRLDLSDYVNPVEKKGLAIKEIRFQPHFTTGAGINTNTGAFIMCPSTGVPGDAITQYSGLKVYATTRAYQNAIDVGIGSPDVLAIEEWTVRQFANDAPDPVATIMWDHSRYGPDMLHPSGYTIISDLLIGIAADNIHGVDTDTLELDIVLVAEPVTVNAKQLTEMLTQAQDL